MSEQRMFLEISGHSSASLANEYKTKREMSYLMLLITPQRSQHPTNSILIYFDNTTKQIKQKYKIRT